MSDEPTIRETDDEPVEARGDRDRPDGEGEETERPRRRRRRRRRRGGIWRVLRWTVRTPFYLLLLLVLLLVGTYFWLQTDSAEERLVALVQARLSEALGGAEVSVGGLDWTWNPLSVEAYDVVIPSPPPVEEPFARVPMVRLDLSLSGRPWRAGMGIGLDQIYLERPDLYLEAGDGYNNLPRIVAGSEGRRRFQVTLGDVVAEGGRLRFEETELPFSLAARDLFVRLQGVGPDGLEGVEGLVTAQGVTLVAPGGDPFETTLSVKGRLVDRRLELTTARAVARRARASGSGFLNLDRADRQLELDLSARGSLGVLVDLGYLEDPPGPEAPPVAGDFQFDGGLSWRPGGWSLAGPLSSPRLTLAERTLEDVEGRLEARPDQVRYEIDRARVWGGAVDGTVVADLAARDGGGVPLAVDLRLDRLSLAETLAAQGLDLGPLYGRVSGEVSYRLRTGAALEGSGWGDLTLEAVGRGETQRQAGLAVNGRVPLEIDRGTVRLSGARLTTPSGSQVLEAEGRYDLSSGQGVFDWQLETAAIQQFQPFLPEGVTRVTGPDGEPRPAPWLPTRGRGTARGQLRLAGREGGGQIGIDLTLDLEGLASPGLEVERAQGGLSLVLGPRGRWIEGLMLELSSDTGALLVNGDLPLGEGPGGARATAAPGAGPPPFDLTLDLVDWPVDSQLLTWVQQDLPVSGRVSGRLELAGSLREPVGEADLTLASAEVFGVAADRLSLDLSFDRETVRFDAIEAYLAGLGEAILEEDGLEGSLEALDPEGSAESGAGGAGEDRAGLLRAAGSFDRASGTISFRVFADGFEIARLPGVDGLEGVGGTVDLDATVSGPLAEPAAQATVQFRDLVLRGQPVGDGAGAVEASWQGGRLQVAGRVPGLFEVEGGGALDPETVDVSLRVRTEGLGRLAAALLPESQASLEGSLAGDLTLTGALGDPSSLELGARLDALTVSWEGRTLSNIEPVVARLDGDRIVIDSLYLGELESESEVFATGTVGLTGERPLDLRVQGSLAADWATLVMPDLEVVGTFDLLASVKGTMAEPAVNGQGELRDAHLVAEGFPYAFDDLRAVVLFSPTEIILDRLEARVGSGSLRAFGRLEDLYAEGGPSYRFQASASSFSLRYPEGFLVRGDAALTVSSTPDGRLLRGTVDLARVSYLEDVEVSFLQLLRGALRESRLQVARTDPFLASTQLALSIEVPEGGVRVRNNIANLEGRASLTVRGNAARPVLFGTVDFEPEGTLVYSDNEFEVERARVTFANPAELEPIIDLVATTEVRRWDVTLNLSGQLDNLQANLVSDPALPDLDVIALLTTGNTFDERRASATTQSPSEVADQLLAGQAANLVSERVNTLFGFDEFRISPVGTPGGGSIDRVGFTVGKRLSSDVYVTYTENPASPEGRLLIVEWEVDEHLTLVLTGKGDDTYAIDARWDRRF